MYVVCVLIWAITYSRTDVSTYSLSMHLPRKGDKEERDKKERKKEMGEERSVCEEYDF